MEKIEDLFKESANMLREYGFENNSYQRPYFPASVIYYGERSKLHHKEILRDISDGWGKDNAENIKFYCIQDTVDHTITDVLSNETVTAKDIMVQYRKLMESERLFVELSSISTYFIFDSSKVDNADQFEKWYREFEYFNSLFGGNVPMKSMLIILLDESFECLDKAHSFRIKLLDLFKSSDCGIADAHIYDSVFVLSNKRNRKGYESFDPTSSSYENNNLLGDLILLTNTNENDLSLRNSSIYGSGILARTVAHGYIEKPNVEIISVVLSVVFDKMKEILNSNENKILKSDELRLALGVDKQKSAIIESIYGEIKDQLPKQDFINYLPNFDSGDDSYAVLDKKSYGCLSGFLKENHFEIIEEKIKNGRPNYKNTYEGLMQKYLSVNQITDVQVVDDEELYKRPDAYNELKEGIEDLIKLYPSNETNNVSTVIQFKTKSKIVEQIIPVINEAFSDSIRKAISTMSAFNSLYNAFNNYVAYSIDEETRKNIEKFFEHKISLYFNEKDRKQDLFNRLMLIGNSTQDMLKVLFDELRTIFTYDQDFKKPLIVLLALILAGLGPNSVTDFIVNALVRDIDKKILLGSDGKFIKKLEVYFINTNNSSNAGLLDAISKLHLEDGEIRTIYNTSADNYFESIFVYDCSEHNMIM